MRRFPESRWPILPSSARVGSPLQYAGEKVRISPKAAIGGYPALTVRKVVRRLTNLLCWNVETVQVILRTDRTEAEAIVRALLEAGLAVAEPSRGVGVWRTTQLAQSFGSATAAKPITRRTADQVLSQLLERVDQVNKDQCFLAKVTKVVLLRSYLRADVDRLSDIDVAVELQPKEADWGRLREATQERVQQLRTIGHRFRNWLEVECWWHLEPFRFPKGRSRAISLIDSKAEKEFIDNDIPEFKTGLIDSCLEAVRRPTSFCFPVPRATMMPHRGDSTRDVLLAGIDPVTARSEIDRAALSKALRSNRCEPAANFRYRDS